MWFNKEDFSLKERRKKIILNNLYGYILPHAGTTHTKNILKHLLSYPFFILSYPILPLLRA